MTPTSDEPPTINDDRLAFAIDACKAAGIDPYPIMADELRAMGYLVMAPAPPEGPEDDF